MALTPEEFYAHAIAVADEEQRLPLAKMTYWDIFPFDEDGLTVAPLRPPTRRGVGLIPTLAVEGARPQRPPA